MTAVWRLSPWVEQRRDHVTFGLQVFPVDTPNEPARHLLAAGQLAEALGFDAFFVGDHPAWGLEGWLHLAALSVTTTRIRLGSIVNCISYRHPVMLARLAADLDNLSHGRLILGVGIGWDANEFANLGLPYLPARERQAALEEALTILRGVWGAEPFSYEGAYFQTHSALVRPLPVQSSPPLLIAGSGEKTTLHQVALYADACNFVGSDVAGGVRTPADVQHKLRVLQDYCARLGRAYDTILRTHLTGWLILAETDAQLAAKTRHYFPHGMEARFHGKWRGFALAATPARAVEYYQAMAEAGIQQFVVELLDAADEETIHLLADEVVPQVQK